MMMVTNGENILVKTMISLTLLLNLMDDLNRVLNSRSSIFAGARCPSLCFCDDVNLRATCTKASLTLIPITLNPNLKKLDLNENNINTIRISSFREVYSNLESLEISASRIQTVEDHAFLGQRKLKVLKLDKNVITKLTNETFVGLHALEILRLNENRLTNLTGQIFAQLANLNILDLSRNQLTYLSLDAFNGLKKLTHLSLRDNRLGEYFSLVTSMPFSSFSSSTSSSLLSSSSSPVRAAISVNHYLHDYRQSLRKPSISNRQRQHTNGSRFLFLPAINALHLPSLIRLDLGLNDFTYVNKYLSPFWNRKESIRPKAKPSSSSEPNESLSPKNGNDGDEDEDDEGEDTDHHADDSDGGGGDEDEMKLITRNSTIDDMKRKKQKPQLSGDVGDNKVGGWSNLRELFLDGCSIKHIEFGSFNRLSSLLILRLNDNHLKQVPSALKQVNKLEVLQVGGNQLTGIQTKSFASLTNLKSLDISNCSLLSNIEPFAFTGLKSLERLELSRNPRLNRIEYDLFDPLINLKYLSLRGNRLRTLDERLSSIATQVDIVDLRDNQFNCNCSVKWMRKLLQNYRNVSEAAVEPAKAVHQSSSFSSFSSSFLSSSSSSSFNVLPSMQSNNFPSTHPDRSKTPSDKSSDTHRNTYPFSSRSSSPSSTSSSPLSSLPSSSPSPSAATQAYQMRVIEVRCVEPAPLKGKLIIDLDVEDIGCFQVESITPIIIALIVGCLLVCGVFVICVVRCRTKLAFLIKGSGVKNSANKHPESMMAATAYTSNRKIFGLAGTRRVNDLEYHHYAKPDCMIHGHVNIADENTIINNLNNPYEIVPVFGHTREDIAVYQDLDYELKLRPITEL